MKIMKKVLLAFFCVFTLVGVTSCQDEEKDISAELQAKYSYNKNYYEIFVRSFADSDGDGIGDFKGIENNIDYLVDLGIEGIWLMPINESDSYHGYDVLDYYSVNPDYGTMEDFESLLATCKKNNIDVIIDFVLNHTSVNNEWFEASVRAQAGTGSSDDEYYKNFYTWITTTDSRYGKKGSDGQTMWYYNSVAKKYYCGNFSGSMPDLNYTNPKVISEIEEIGKYWIEKGVSGFRLDGVKFICGANEYTSYTINNTYTILSNLREKYNAYSQELYGKNIYIVSEVYDSESLYSEFYKCVDSTFDFDIAKKIITSVNGNESNYTSTVEDFLEDYAEKTVGEYEAIMAPFITNHDQTRVATAVNGDLVKMRMAAEMLLTLPGNPFVYYGEELGMFGEAYDGKTLTGYGTAYDETIRQPFLWGNTSSNAWSSNSWIKDPFNSTVQGYDVQKDDESSLYNTYKTLLNLRKTNYALKYGDFTSISLPLSSHVQAFYRTLEYEGRTFKILVVMNFNDEAIDTTTFDFISGNNIYYSTGTNNYKDGMIAGMSTAIFQIEG